MLEAYRDVGGRLCSFIYLSPAGKIFCQEDAKRLKNDYDRLILVCGHYEGIDERFIEECVDEELSLGDFVLTGGEIPAMAVADAVCRLVPGVLPDESCFTDESTGTGCWNIRNTPVQKYGMEEPFHPFSYRDITPILPVAAKTVHLRTLKRRPDLYDKLDLSSKSDQKLLSELEE